MFLSKGLVEGRGLNWEVLLTKLSSEILSKVLPV